jgi:hypothetical protein
MNAPRKNIDLIVIGTRGRTELKKILHGEFSKRRDTARTLFGPSCQIGISKADIFSRALRYVPMYETEHFELPRKSYSKHSGPKKIFLQEWQKREEIVIFHNCAASIH